MAGPRSPRGTAVPQIERRTNIVTVEVQLWPQPPQDARTHWWGSHDLTFYAKGTTREVWHQRIPEVEGSSRATTVTLHPAYGWIVTFTYDHVEAVPALRALHLERFLTEEDRVHEAVAPQ